jgi:hypothetical protein
MFIIYNIKHFWEKYIWLKFFEFFLIIIYYSLNYINFTQNMKEFLLNFKLAYKYKLTY